MGRWSLDVVLVRPGPSLSTRLPNSLDSGAWFCLIMPMPGRCFELGCIRAGFLGM